jgi:hypothetical protein
MGNGGGIMKAMKRKILALPMVEGTLRIDIDIYGWSKCYLVEGTGSLYLGAALIENLARKILAHLEGEPEVEGEEIEGKSARRVITLSEEHHTLYLGGEGSERRLFVRDRDGKVIARKGLTGPGLEKWREELRDQCG